MATKCERCNSYTYVVQLFKLFKGVLTRVDTQVCSGCGATHKLKTRSY